LRAELEIFVESLPLRQVENVNPNLIGELPSNQFLVPFRASHVIGLSTTGAGSLPEEIESNGLDERRIFSVKRRRTTHFLHAENPLHPSHQLHQLHLSHLSHASHANDL